MAKKPGKEAIKQALETTSGKRVKSGNATIVDWLSVICLAEAIQQTWDIHNT